VLRRALMERLADLPHLRAWAKRQFSKVLDAAS
jgi:hypothetical protein